MDRIELLSHAKVNLTLEVCGRRADGFHDIDSVAQVIDLADELSVSNAESGVIKVTIALGDAPAGRGNLVYRACEAFFDATGIRGGAKCILRKRIPAQAGLGGGSGNAAAAVVALDRLYQTHASLEALSAIAASVSSDAALFVCGGTVRMRGRGDQVSLLPDAPKLDLVIVKPGVGVSTQWAYSELDKRPHGKRGASDEAQRAIGGGDRSALVTCLSNDFDPVVSEAFAEVHQARVALVRAGAERAVLCGSGSAVFGVFGSSEDARRAADSLREAFESVFVARTVTRRECAEVLIAQ